MHGSDHPGDYTDGILPLTTIRAGEHDPVDNPSHYTTGAVECIDALEAALGEEGFRAFCRGNAIKYLWRAGRKGDVVEDLRKAEWYVDREIRSRS